MATLDTIAKNVRKTIMGQVLEDGTCPLKTEIAKKHSLSTAEIHRVFHDLEAAFCIALQNESHVDIDSIQGERLSTSVPELGEVFYARPFAVFKNHFPIWVDGEQKWYCECAVEACGVSHMFPNKEVVVRSICRQTKEPIELVGLNGRLRDYSPKTLKVHFGFPVKNMPDDAIGWCDYNSFFISECAFRKWTESHPNIRGVIRDPITTSNMVSMINRGRLEYDYKFKLPLFRILFQPRKYGLTKLSPRFGVHLYDPFFLPTPGMIKKIKGKYNENFIGLTWK